MRPDRAAGRRTSHPPNIRIAAASTRRTAEIFSSDGTPSFCKKQDKACRRARSEKATQSRRNAPSFHPQVIAFYIFTTIRPTAILGC